MHKYLKSVGFSGLSQKNELDKLLEDVKEHYDRKKVTAETEDHRLFAEISKEFGYDCGITICGEYDEHDNFQMEYYFPVFFRFPDHLIRRCGGGAPCGERILCGRLRRYAGGHFSDFLSAERRGLPECTAERNAPRSADFTVAFRPGGQRDDPPSDIRGSAAEGGGQKAVPAEKFA